MRSHPLAWLAAALALAAVVSTLPAPAASAGPSAPLDANGDAFVVIAIVDTGINPYHRAFAGKWYPRNIDANPTNDVDFTRHPSAYLAGFPADAPALALTLDAPNYAAAVQADGPAYAAVADKALYWIPGTKIVGAYDSGSSFLLEPDYVHILDESGHGTGTASLAAANARADAPASLCPECLLVVVEGSAGFEWATRQPWIDIVSNSWGARGNVGIPTGGVLGSQNGAGRVAAERGQTILFASGNGVENAFLVPVATYSSDTVGPSWYVRVGAYNECSPSDAAFCEAPVLAAGKPADLVGPGQGWIPAAAHDHLVGHQAFGGTSAATPVAAGYFGNTLLTFRKAMGDTLTGARPGQVVAAGTPIVGTPYASAAADGVVTRGELWDIAFHSAAKSPNGTGPYNYAPAATPGNYVWNGWGMTNARAMSLAKAVALGAAPFPERADERLLFLADKSAQEALWGGWDRDADGQRDSYRAELSREIQRTAAP